MHSKNILKNVKIFRIVLMQSKNILILILRSEHSLRQGADLICSVIWLCHIIPAKVLLYKAYMKGELQ